MLFNNKINWTKYGDTFRHTKMWQISIYEQMGYYIETIKAKIIHKIHGIRLKTIRARNTVNTKEQDAARPRRSEKKV